MGRAWFFMPAVSAFLGTPIATARTTVSRLQGRGSALTLKSIVSVDAGGGIGPYTLTSASSGHAHESYALANAPVRKQDVSTVNSTSTGPSLHKAGPRVIAGPAQFKKAASAITLGGVESEAGETDLPSAGSCGGPTTLSIACTIGSVLLVVLFIGVGCWASDVLVREPAAEGSLGVDPAVYDNARSFSCLFIVFFHLVTFPEMGAQEILHKWIHDDYYKDAVPHLASALVGLALNVFSFLSGYFSRGGPNPRRWRNLLELSLGAVLYLAVLQPFVLLITRSLSLPRWIGDIMCASPGVAWYLQSLVLWRLLAYGCHAMAARTETPTWPWLIASSFSWYSSNPFISIRVWSCDHAAVYLPAFIVGMLFPLGDLVKKVPSSGWMQVFGTALIAGFMLSTWSPNNFFPNLPDKEVRMDFARSTMCPLDPQITLFWAQGLFKTLTLSGVSLVFVAFVCPRSPKWFTYAGGEGALYSYLLHIFALYGLYFLVGCLPIPVLEGPLITVIARLLELAFSACTVLALASKPCISVFAYLLKPTWLVNRLLEPPAKPGALEAQKENADK